MKSLIALILVITFSVPINAQEWISPIDKKYMEISSNNFSKFDKARSLLNSYRGNREILVEADKLLRDVLQSDDTFAPAYREYGRLFLMSGHKVNDDFRHGSLSSAESSILKSIDLEPNYADSYVLLGHLYTKNRIITEAKKALEKAESIGTDTPWLHLNWADINIRERNVNQAIKRYEHVVKKGTSNKKAYSNALNGLASAYWALQDWDKVNESYINLIQYEPTSAWNWGYYSHFLLYIKGDIDAAIQKGEKALSIMNYGLGRFTLACALYTKWAMLKNNPVTTLQAQQYFDKAWSIYPYPEKVIEETQKYQSTRITSTALSKWLTNKGIGRSKAAPVL